MTPPFVGTTSGQAQSTYTPNAEGLSTQHITLDNEDQTTNVGVDDTPPTINFVNKQHVLLDGAGVDEALETDETGRCRLAGLGNDLPCFGSKSGLGRQVSSGCNDQRHT